MHHPVVTAAERRVFSGHRFYSWGCRTSGIVEPLSRASPERDSRRGGITAMLGACIRLRRNRYTLWYHIDVDVCSAIIAKAERQQARSVM